MQTFNILCERLVLSRGGDFHLSMQVALDGDVHKFLGCFHTPTIYHYTVLHKCGKVGLCNFA